MRCSDCGRARRVIRSASGTGDAGGHRSSQRPEDEQRPSSGGVIGHQWRGGTPDIGRHSRQGKIPSLTVSPS